MKLMENVAFTLVLGARRLKNQIDRLSPLRINGPAISTVRLHSHRSELRKKLSFDI